MKYSVCLILLASLALTSAYSARPKNYNNFNDKKSYQQQQQHHAAASNNINSKASSTNEKESQILRHENEVKGDGTYHYDFETSNGIKRNEQGAVDGTIQGSSSYISPEGIEIKTSYVADETGYHPVGDHIPQIPDYILRALEYIRTHPYVEKDYYTGEIKDTAHGIRKPLAPTTQRPVKHSAFNNNYKKGSNNSKFNFRH